MKSFKELLAKFVKTDSRQPVTSIRLEGREWFDRSGGNSYHSTRVYINGKWVLDTGLTYGYGDQYISTAVSELNKYGFELPRYYWRELPKVAVYSSITKSTKRELWKPYVDQARLDSFKIGK